MKNFIGKNIRYLRNQKGHTQEALAQKVGLNRGNIASYEKGTAHPSIFKLQEIASFFDVNLADLVDKDLSVVNIPKQIIKMPLTPRADHRQQKDLLNQINSIQFMLEAYSRSRNYQLDRYRQVSQTIQRLIRDHEQILDLSEQLLDVIKTVKEKISQPQQSHLQSQ